MQAASNGSRLPLRRGLRVENGETAHRSQEIREALDAEGARDVTIVAAMNLDRLQVHRKWEMSDQCSLAIMATRAEMESRW